MLPASIQSAEETETGRGCFLLAMPLLESNLQKRLKLAKVVLLARSLFRPWSMILEKQRIALFFSMSESDFL